MTIEKNNKRSRAHIAVSSSVSCNNNRSPNTYSNPLIDLSDEIEVEETPNKVFHYSDYNSEQNSLSNFSISNSLLNSLNISNPITRNMPSNITLRIRSPTGTFRLNNLSLADDFFTVKTRLENECKVQFNVGEGQQVVFSRDPQFRRDVFSLKDILGDVNIQHGDMIYSNIKDGYIAPNPLFNSASSSSTSNPVHYTPSQTANKKILSDGTIQVLNPTTATASGEGFRPGMKSLRDIKMQWKLQDFLDLDNQFVFKIKSQNLDNLKNKDKADSKEIIENGCKIVRIHINSLKKIQDYMNKLNFNVIRVAYLYGKINKETGESWVSYVYEPLQENTEENFHLLPDENQEKINILCSYLELEKIGIMICHPPREKGFFFSNKELIFIAENQLEYSNDIAMSPFITIKMTLDYPESSSIVTNKEEEEEKKKKNSVFETQQGYSLKPKKKPTTNNNAPLPPAPPVQHQGPPSIVVDAYQVSLLCMEMVAEGALELSEELGFLKVNPTFTALVDGKKQDLIDTSYFINPVPIGSFNDSETNFTPLTIPGSAPVVPTSRPTSSFASRPSSASTPTPTTPQEIASVKPSNFVNLNYLFPSFNHIDHLPNVNDLKKILSLYKRDGWNFYEDLLCDINLLLFISQFLSIEEDLKIICDSLLHKESINEGYILLLRSIAGLD